MDSTTISKEPGVGKHKEDSTFDCSDKENLLLTAANQSAGDSHETKAPTKTMAATRSIQATKQRAPLAPRMLRSKSNIPPKVSLDHAESLSKDAATGKGHGKELRRHLRPSVVTPAPRLLMLNTNSTVVVTTNDNEPKAATPSFQSPPMLTSPKGGMAGNNTSVVVCRTPSKSLATNLLAKIQIESQESSQMKKGTTMMTLKVVTSEALSFPEVLDAMLWEATTRNSTALHWASDGQAFVVDPKQDEELKEFLQAYFNHKNYASLQRQLNNYGWRKHTTGPFKGMFYNPLFHRDKCESTHLSPIRRQTPKKSPAMSPKPPAQSASTMPHQRLVMKPSSQTKSARRSPRIRIKITPRNAATSKKSPVTQSQSRRKSPCVTASNTTSSKKRAKKAKKNQRASKKTKKSKENSKKIVSAGKRPGEIQGLGNASLPISSSPLQIDDLQSAALSLYKGEESLDLLDLIGKDGLPTGTENENNFGRQLMMPMDEGNSSHISHFQIQNNQLSQSTWSWNNLPSSHQPFLSPPASSQHYFVPSTDEAASREMTYSTMTDDKNAYSETSFPRISRRPSAEDFAKLLDDISAIDSPPQDDSSMPQQVSAFLHREKEIINEIESDRHVTPSSGRVQMTLLDRTSQVKTPSKIISPIDPSAVKERSFSNESFFFVDTPKQSIGKNDKKVFLPSPMETTGVRQRRAQLKLGEPKPPASHPPASLPSASQHSGDSNQYYQPNHLEQYPLSHPPGGVRLMQQSHLPPYQYPDPQQHKYMYLGGLAPSIHTSRQQPMPAAWVARPPPVQGNYSAFVQPSSTSMPYTSMASIPSRSVAKRGMVRASDRKAKKRD